MDPPAPVREAPGAAPLDVPAACARVEAAAACAGEDGALAGAQLAALGAALAAAEDGKRDAALPLWEAVVVASALYALRRRAASAAWAPWRPYPAALAALVARLPRAPGGLAARGAVMNFRPGTLRARLAADAALRAQVEAAAEVAAVPLWLRVAAAPFALVYLVYQGVTWLLTTGAELLLGRVLILGDGVRWGISRVAVALWDWVVAPLARGVRDYALRPLCRFLYHCVAMPLWRAGAAFYSNALLPAWNGAAWVARNVAQGCRCVGRGLRDYIFVPARGGVVWAARGLRDYILVPVWRALYQHVLTPIGRGFAWACVRLCRGIELVYDYGLYPVVRYGLWYSLWYGLFTPMYWAGWCVGKCCFYAGKGLHFLGSLGWTIAEWLGVNLLTPMWVVVKAGARGVWAVVRPVAAAVRGAAVAVAGAIAAGARSVVAGVLALLRGGR